jgi:hypothetical protein
MLTTAIIITIGIDWAHGKVARKRRDAAATMHGIPQTRREVAQVSANAST